MEVIGLTPYNPYNSAFDRAVDGDYRAKWPLLGGRELSRRLGVEWGPSGFRT